MPAPAPAGISYNSFSKEERVAFENLLEGFQDALVMSRNVSIYNTDQTMMERTNNTIWRPQPYISRSFSGTDQTDNFSQYTQLSVPSQIGFNRSVPWIMTATELRDALQEQRLGNAAKQKLASDINVQTLSVASSLGSLVVKRTTAATGYDDVAQCEAIFNEQGVQFEDRYLALSTRDYNGMASNLASRQTLAGKALTGYEKSRVGEVASFDTYKLDYANRIAAAAGGSVTIDTRDSAVNYWVPKSVTTSPSTSERLNVDNRFQTVTLSANGGIVAGDCFTIAGVYAVHHITKQSTGQLKTFRVVSVANTGTTVVITPPIISNQVTPVDSASAEYQNCVVETKAANSAIVWLNTAASYINCFWQKDAIEILPGRYAVPSDAGVNVIRASTDQGIELVMQKFYDINTMKIKYRLDTLFGVVNKQPEMSGIILFGQS
jgi:hypothetical protein